MRIKHRYITYDGHLTTIQPLKHILDSYSHAYTYKEDPGSAIPSFKYQLEFYLYEDDHSFNTLQQKIDPLLKPQVAVTEYEKADFDHARWFIAQAGEYQYPQPEDDYMKITFNPGLYCKWCGMDKVQQAPYRLKTEPKQHNKQFWGLHWDFDALFVRQEAKNILEQENIKGIRFSNPVLHKKNVPIEGFYQLHIDTVLNKGFDDYNTQTITCRPNNEENANTDPSQTYCGRVKFHHPIVGGYVFDNIFDPGFDLVKSNEYFGSGGSANKLLIVSKRFKELVESNKLKGLHFIPVMHERFIPYT